MANIHTDWAWKPDGLTKEAERRWMAGVRRRRFEAEEQLINFNARQARQVKLGKRQIAAMQAAQLEVRAYYAQREAEGWSYSQRVIKNEVLNVGRNKHASAKGADGKGRGVVDTIQFRYGALDNGSSDVAMQHRSRNMRRTRAGKQPTQHYRTSRISKGECMSTTTIVILDGANTRPWQRYTDLELACHAAEHEQYVKDAPDYMVVHQGTVMSSLEESELAALVKAAEVDTELTVPQQLQNVKKWLLEFGEEHDALSEDAAKSLEAAEGPKAKSKAASKPKTETSKASAKKTSAKPAAKGKKKTRQEARQEVRDLVNTPKKGKTTPKARPRAATTGDGLGRPNTMGRYVNELILKGNLSDEEIVKMTQKQFPEHTIRDYYPNWYRARLRKAGLLKEG